MRKLSCKNIISLVLLLGLLAALFLCGQRISLEAKNKHFAVVMTEASAAQIRDLPDTVQIFDGSVYQKRAVLLVEDDAQYSYVPDEGIDQMLSQFPAGSDRGIAGVRCFHLTEKYAARYNTLGYTGAEEIENILYRAVTDRNIRLIWLEPFVDAETGETITDGGIYAQLLENLCLRLQRHGLTLDAEYSLFPVHTPGAALLLLTAFGVAAGGVLLLITAFGLDEQWGIVLLVVCCIGCAVLYALRAGLAVSVFALSAAAIFPCLALQLAAKLFAVTRTERLGRELLSFGCSLAQCFLIALMGGFFVGALQSSTEYLLAIDNFRGVKLSQLLPILFAVWILLRQLCPLKEILSGKKYILLLALLLLLAIVALFILRTGDGVLSVSVLEQRFRNTLEHALLVRPRTKEFLLAWPCFALACILCRCGAKRFCWPFFILSAPGFSSVVNTFCHSRAPIWVSTVRSLLGALIGLALGLVLTALFHRTRKPQD